MQLCNPATTRNTELTTHNHHLPYLCNKRYLMSTPDKRWHVIYTRARSEKKIHERLQRIGIDSYLPLQKVRKQWSDRKKWVHEPLFRSYLFVKITPSEYQTVLMVEGVVKYVYFEGKPAIVQEKQMEDLRRLVNNEILMEFAPMVHKGDRVAIRTGPMAGVEGILQDFQGEKRVILQINGLEQALAIMVPITDVEKVG